MTRCVPQDRPNELQLARLNRLSRTRGVTPHVDLDWSQETTSEEFRSLYRSWSLLLGTGLDRDLTECGHADFARYQQINLMLITGLVERHGIRALARLYDLDRSQGFSEYVGHFIKEEIYHFTMFMRAVDKLQAAMPHRAPVPQTVMDTTLRWLFRFIAVIPGQKLRSTLTCTMFRFAEQITMYANTEAQVAIQRPESLVRQIWGFHALEEARHLVFDEIVIERNRVPKSIGWLPPLLAVPCCVCISVLLNCHDIWAARQLGVRVGYWQLPMLVARTTAPFKRRVFGLLRTTRTRANVSM